LSRHEISAKTTNEHVNWCLKPDDRARGFYESTVCLRQYRSTTTRNYRIGFLQQVCQHFRFTFSKSDFAFVLKDIFDRYAGLLFNHYVTIEP
jgi:hypothetical protein